MRFLLRRVFERAGHEVTDAANGQAALSAVRERLPDLVVSDLMMPMMDGPELIRRLRDDPATAAIPILVISAFGDIPSRVDAALSKPYDLREVVAKATMLLAGKDGRE